VRPDRVELPTLAVQFVVVLKPHPETKGISL
jgi:hypothetical protein